MAPEERNHSADGREGELDTWIRAGASGYVLKAPPTR